MNNKYKGTCNGCGCSVPAQAGHCTKVDNKWACWCNDCVPAQAAKPPQHNIRRLTAAFQIIWPYDKSELNTVRSFPKARFNANKDQSVNIDGYTGPFWTVSTDEGDLSRILEIADKLNLVIDDLLKVEQSDQAVLADLAGLYPYQIDGVDWLSKRRKALLADDMGLGKTVQSLRALPEGSSTLVVCPAVVKHNWAIECDKWRPDLKPVVLSGKNNFRLPNPGEVVIINYEILPVWLAGKKVKDKKYVHYNHYTVDQKTHLEETSLIIDEAHFVKNYKTQRAKRVTGLCKHTKSVWALSGTPLENRAGDLWGTLSALGFNRDVFKSYRHFLECFNATHNGWGWDFHQPKEIVPELMRRVMLRRIRAEVLPDLPTKTYSWITTDVDGNLEAQLDQLWDKYGEGYDLPSFEEFSLIRAELASSRIPAVLEYVEDCEEQDVPLIVFSAHTEPVRTVAKRDGWECITGATSAVKRTELVSRFQAGELKGLACTIKAAGIGLTLTHAWKALFVDMDWTPAKNWQAEDRICRIGQKSNKCEIIRMVSEHPMDQHVQKLLVEKIETIQKAIDDEIGAVDHSDLEERIEIVTAEIEHQARVNQDSNDLESLEDWYNSSEPIPLDELIPF